MFIKYDVRVENKEGLTWKTTHRLLLVGALLRQPQIIEPFNNFHLQVARHSSHPHVRLHAVQLRCNQQYNRFRYRLVIVNHRDRVITCFPGKRANYPASRFSLFRPFARVVARVSCRADRGRTLIFRVLITHA